MATNNGNNESDAPEGDSDSDITPPSTDDLEDMLDDLTTAMEVDDWSAAQGILAELTEMLRVLREYVEGQIQ